MSMRQTTLGHNEENTCDNIYALFVAAIFLSGTGGATAKTYFTF